MRPVIAARGGARYSAAGMTMDPEFFDLVGVKPWLGRFELSRLGATDLKAAVSYEAWQSILGGSPGVIGMRIDAGHGVLSTITAVTPPGFRITRDGLPEIYELVDPGSQRRATLSPRSSCIARLAPGVSAARAQASINAVSDPSKQIPRDWAPGVTYVVEPLREYLFGDRMPAMWTLQAMAGLMLLMACFTACDLLLARANRQRHECALLLALGAGQADVLRRFLLECLMLTGLGGAAGLLAALWGIDIINGFVASFRAGMPAIAINRLTLCFACAMCLALGVVIGVISGWRSGSFRLSEALQAGGHGVRSPGRMRISRLLVVAELAICVAVLMGAGLAVRSFANLSRTRLGIGRTDVLAVPLGFAFGRDEAAVLRVLKGLPGVESAALALSVPLASLDTVTGPPRNRVRIPGINLTGPDYLNVYWSEVSPDYFDVLGIPLKAGRVFRDSDNERTAPVAIVNETLARRWGAGGPIGRTIETEYAPAIVVGVVADTMRMGPRRREPLYEFYLAGAQTSAFSNYALIRSSAAPSALVRILNEKLPAIRPTLTAGTPRSIRELLDRAMFEDRAAAVLMALFGGLAAILAALGTYGVMAHHLSERTKELAVRTVMGARPSHIAEMVAKQTLWLALAGAGIGTLLFLSGARYVSSLLFGVSPADPGTAAMAVGGVVAVALAASLLAARRAAEADPLRALNSE